MAANEVVFFLLPPMNPVVERHNNSKSLKNIIVPLDEHEGSGNRKTIRLLF